ncbi:SGNH/GDSL hydrolase family protein [Burkholderia multivorans]|uniref:SGNH/GDSL hydrolase family protein n=1 Tax=Burkholderia multivorans TaxID=87883 RepID=UPI00201A123E|nr:SGNH/GDSL hydrolase family protein [Burkholderia multivorans]UQP00542.1 SGNH/GDSL hydrolase family protein [Burkholderia multivorans]
MMARSALSCVLRLWGRAASLMMRRPIVNVLIIGDSHVRVFEHAWFRCMLPNVRFTVEYVPGATAIGIVNRHSITSAWSKFDTALDEIERDLVIVNLGEVDTGYSLWRLVETRGDAMSEIFERAVNNYCEYIEDLSKRGRVLVLSAPLPTLSDEMAQKNRGNAIREQVDATQRQRTELTLQFNARVMAFCAQIGVSYLDSSPSALGANGVVKDSWRRKDLDHHYARWPYARDLARQLGPLLADIGQVRRRRPQHEVARKPGSGGMS